MKKFSLFFAVMFFAIVFVTFSIEKPKIKILERNDVSMSIKWDDNNSSKKIIVVHTKKDNAVKPALEKTYKPVSGFDSSLTESYTGLGNLVVYSGNDKTGTIKLSNTNADTDYEIDFYYVNESNKTFENKGNPFTESFFTSAVKPSKGTRNVAFTKVSDTQFEINWKRGDGKKCIMIIKKGKGGLTLPVNGTEYKASEEFGKGSKTDKDSTFVVYSGSGNDVTVKNLQPNTFYTMQVVEYNGSGEKINYQSATGFFNPNNRTTLLETPTLYNAENITESSFVAKWKKVDGADVYELDLGYDKEFQKMHPDFTAIDVGNINEYMFEELKPGKYYLRVRAFGNKNHSENSKPIQFELKAK